MLIKRPQNIVVVGGNAAGAAAAAKAKRNSPSSNVILYERSKFISTGTCELPYLISGEIKDYKDIVFFSADSFKEEKQVEVFVEHSVESIDRRSKKIAVKNVISGHIYYQDYDKLILTTGSSAINHPDLLEPSQNLFHLKSVPDYIKIDNYLKSNKCKDVLIIGGGYIGLETTESFHKSGFNVTILERDSLPLGNSEIEIKNRIKETLEKKNIRFYGNSDRLKVFKEGNYIKKIVANGIIFEPDMVIVSIGFKPRTQIGQAAMLNIGKYNGFKTDSFLKTNDPNILSAGDNSEVTNFITKKNDYIPLATIAHSMGHIAGDNASGAFNKFLPVIKNIAVKLFDNCYSQVGLTHKEATEHRFNFEVITAEVPNLVKVMSNTKPTFGKILYEKNSKQILGASFFGQQEAIGNADIIATLIQNKITGSTLYNANYNYSPPCSPFINLLSVLGRKINKD
ncbi:MAG: FAD-dependent oxidoreductase [Melioribacteraceae bacterium]|nr:FAD-dependent oxidoreductase [Melioribacteraceae bacterium]